MDGELEQDSSKRGGSKKWASKGPRPARHIPWPEIFKHHLSVVEGHMKMIDMIRKHTVEGSGNHRTIVACLDRAQQMLRDTKEATRTFVPPNNQREHVPIGSSSLSMYPGYSPADHTYGEAAEEFGRGWSKVKAENGIGFEDKASGIEYKLGSGNSAGQRTIPQIRGGKASMRPAAGTGANGIAVASRRAAPAEQVNDTAKEDTNPYFVIDVNPTPVNMSGIAPKPSSKRSTNGDAAADEGASKKKKKAKTKHEAQPEPELELESELPLEVEREDISAEVDARLEERRKKRQGKKDNKRKRESETSEAGAEDAEPVGEDKAEKPKKKKSKKLAEESDGGEKRAADAESEGQTKKKSKKSKKEKS